MEQNGVVTGRRVMDPLSNEYGVIIAVDGPRIAKNHVSVQMETGQAIMAIPLDEGIEGFDLMPIDGNEDSRPNVQDACHQSIHEFEGTAANKQEFWREKCSNCGLARMVLDQVLGQSFPLEIDEDATDDATTQEQSSRGSDLDQNGELKKPIRRLISGLHPSKASVEEFIEAIHPRAAVRVSPSSQVEKRTQLMRHRKGGASIDEYDRDEHGMLTPLWVVVEMPGEREPSNEVIELMQNWRYTPLDGSSNPDYGGGGWPVPPTVGPDRLDITGCYVFRRTWV